MENGFELLEEKVRKAAELVKRAAQGEQGARGRAAARRKVALAGGGEEARPRWRRRSAAAAERAAGEPSARPGGRGSSAQRARGGPRPRSRKLVEVLETGPRTIVRPAMVRHRGHGRDKPDLVHVEIFGQTYAVRAGRRPGLRRSSWPPTSTRRCARSAEPSGAVDSVRIAVLAALNIADECFRLAPGREADEQAGCRRSARPRLPASSTGLTAGLDDSLPRSRA